MNCMVLAAMIASSAAMAQNLDCEHIGKIYMNGDTLLIEYSPEMGFTNNTDLATLLGVNSSETTWTANNWGAKITIPNALSDGKMNSGLVQFSTYDDPYRKEFGNHRVHGNHSAVASNLRRNALGT